MDEILSSKLDIDDNLIEFEYKINIKNISKKESFIICILSFWDDTTLMADCPFKMQKLIEYQENGLRVLRMKMHPDKSQLVYLGRKCLNTDQNDYKIKIPTIW